MSWVTINDAQFRDLIATRARLLMDAATYLCDHPVARDSLARPLVGCLLSQSIQLEELLDAYGASRNNTWRRLRSLIATIKQFSDVSYTILHIKHVLPSYRLLPIEHDFAGAIDSALAFTGDVLFRAAGALLEHVDELGIGRPESTLDESMYAEPLPPGQLASNRDIDDSNQVRDVSEIVTLLATAFLNLASESKLVHVAGRAEPGEYECFIPDPVSESNLRHLKFSFHNLQTLYDTYVYDTKTERLDRDLPVLRGHISVVYHLLEVATAFIHYHERHGGCRDRADEIDTLVDDAGLLNHLMQFAITFASYYLGGAQSLCQFMLKRYAEVGRIEVSAPRYRGFHVRPSTLVAKIVTHYGSEVTMSLDGETYDASTPLEIFRANEKINARKRRWLATQVAQCPYLQTHDPDADVQALAKRLIGELAQQGKVVLYEQPLQMPERCRHTDGILMEWVIDEMARLQAMGKIDIQTELKITFTGDRRVLADIELLANSGYGEDIFGNNLPLPKEISYLRR